MSAIDGEVPPVHGRVDVEGRLIEAEDRLAALNEAAGGAIGEPLAVPALATLARLARRLGVLISRKVTVADGSGDLDLWVRAQPGTDGVRLAISGWRPRPAAVPLLDATPIVTPAEAGAWRWETDSALHLVAISPEAGPCDGFHPAGMLGQPLTALFSLVEDADGALPLLAAVAANAAFDGQQATVRPSDRPVLLAGIPRRDRLGGFAGFAGTTRDAAPPAPSAPSASSAPSAWAAPAAPVASPPNADATLFATRLSTALRTPLGRIIANADSISAGPDGPVNAAYAGYAADIAAAGRHLLGLVDDLIDLETVERLDFAIKCEQIDLADLARRATGLLAVRASAADVTLEPPAEGVALPAAGEFRRVLQILVNLIGNALRYAPRGTAVTVEISQHDDTAMVTVADQGKGIAAEHQVRIFEKFERVDPREPGGSGLGLYIARRLARAMGGDITVESVPGSGARFTLALPAYN